ncbi:hypothetical protein [Gordonia sp. ABSL49_1]|uniref:hypothetical protein n=1 Tax=Gordonia sp. ABSL49_1 TaxID=2920941 RepID=UPI001F0E48A7|nr:hypothetical protein [Gordonia sp. ABSL49_1]MCH5641086.1 hypothetical protein [Gordonia sp. ABSL49_1]
MRTRAMQGLVAVVAALTLAWTGMGQAAADPNIQLPGVDDGVPNCAVLQPRAFAGYIGTNDPKPARKMDENFAKVPKDWCNTSVGFSRLWFGKPNGVTFGIPDTPHALFPYNNAEMLAKPIFKPGMTMTMRVGGTQQIGSWAGTTGWGVSNRSIDPLGLEIAWFMWNDGNAYLANTSEIVKPIINALGMDFPRGFFLMTKKAGEIVPQIRLLPTSYLKKEHDYAVVLGKKDVTFYIDGKEAGTDVAPFYVDGKKRGGKGTHYGTFTNAPIGTWYDISRQPVPLLGQMWLDSGYWFPLPLPQWNNRWQTAYMKRYVQGPSNETPLTLTNSKGW